MHSKSFTTSFAYLIAHLLMLTIIVNHPPDKPIRDRSDEFVVRPDHAHRSSCTNDTAAHATVTPSIHYCNSQLLSYHTQCLLYQLLIIWDTTFHHKYLILLYSSMKILHDVTLTRVIYRPDTLDILINLLFRYDLTLYTNVLPLGRSPSHISLEDSSQRKRWCIKLLRYWSSQRRPL